MLETGLVGSGFAQLAILVDCLTCNATVRPPSPPPREDSLGAVDSKPSWNILMNLGLTPRPAQVLNKQV